MNCFRCGLEVEQGSAFCIHCGAPITMTAPPQAAPSQGFAAPQQTGGMPPQGSRPQQSAPPKKKRTGLIIGLVAGGVALIGILAAAYFLFFSGPGIKGLWVCEDRGWALRIEDSVLTEYSPAGTDKTSYTYTNGQGTAMLSVGEAGFSVNGDEMTLALEETGEEYLFTRQDDADAADVVAAGLRGLWSSEELGGVIELGKKGTLTIYSISGESDGAYRFDVKKGRGIITLDGGQYLFTAGWDVISVEEVGDFVRADKGMDVAAFVQQYGVSPLAATWYETTGQFGSITFEKDGIFQMELYGQIATGTYTFDNVTGEGVLTSDKTGETTVFVLLDGTLTLEGMTYTQQYVEQPGAEDYKAAIVDVWVSTIDEGHALEFFENGTMLIYAGDESFSGTYTFNPLDRTGTITPSIDYDTETYTFSVSEDMLYVEDYPYIRLSAMNNEEEPVDSLLGLWYDEAGEAGTLYFDQDGLVILETHGVMYSGTYTFDKAAGSVSMVVLVDGEETKLSLYLLYGTLYTDNAIYTRNYVEQTP